MDPGDVVGNIVYWRNPANGVGLTIWLKHEPEINVIAGAIPTLSDGLASETIAEVVHPVLAEGPGVTGRQSPRVAPHQRGSRTRQPLRQGLAILLSNYPHLGSLILG